MAGPTLCWEQPRPRARLTRKLVRLLAVRDPEGGTEFDMSALETQHRAEPPLWTSDGTRPASLDRRVGMQRGGAA